MRHRTPVILLGASLIIGCGPAAPVTTDGGNARISVTTSSIPPRSTSTLTPATTSTLARLLTSTDLHDLLTWFAPNMGSLDFPDLFSEPGKWPRTRDTVDEIRDLRPALPHP